MPRIPAQQHVPTRNSWIGRESEAAGSEMLVDGPGETKAAASVLEPVHGAALLAKRRDGGCGLRSPRGGASTASDLPFALKKKKKKASFLSFQTGDVGGPGRPVTDCGGPCFFRVTPERARLLPAMRRQGRSFPSFCPTLPSPPPEGVASNPSSSSGGCQIRFRSQGWKPRRGRNSHAQVVNLLINSAEPQSKRQLAQDTRGLTRPIPAGVQAELINYGAANAFINRPG